MTVKAPACSPSFRAAEDAVLKDYSVGVFMKQGFGATPRTWVARVNGERVGEWSHLYAVVHVRATDEQTKAKADEIMEREKDRAPGVMFLEPDEMPNKEVSVER